MRECLAFLLPPGHGVRRLRLARLVLGRKFKMDSGSARLAIGLAVGMLVFSQTVLLTALVSVNASRLLGLGGDDLGKPRRSF